MSSNFSNSLPLVLTFVFETLMCCVATEPPSYNLPAYKTVKEEHVYGQRTRIPAGMRADATFIKLKSNKIAGLLGDFAFTNFTSLLQLDMNNNDLVDVSYKAFVGTLIEYLSINHNELNGDFPDLCALNATLKVIDLSYNKLLHVPDERLSCLQTLLLLDLNDNRLQQIPNVSILPNGNDFHSLWMNGNDYTLPVPIPLDNLTGLNHVTMNSIRVTTFPDFSALPKSNSLHTLRLSANNITQVTPQAQAGLSKTRLRSLYLTETGDMLIRLAPALKYLRNIICYYADTIDTMSFPYLPSLSMVTLRYTSLTSLPDMSALNTTLVVVYIQDSPKLNPDPAEFSRTFAQLPLIYTLNLVGNNLTTLPDMFQLLPALTSLYLAKNPWHCGCKITWMLNSSYVGAGYIRDFTSGYFTCKSPPSLAGAALHKLSVTDMANCSEGWYITCKLKQ